MVGSALVRRLESEGCHNLLFADRASLDLCEQAAVREWFRRERPEYVFLAAARVGGILANSTYPADFIYENLAVAVNVIHAAFEVGVKRLVFLGSSCIYPRDCPQPMQEEYLLTSALEKTNEAYAVAKIAGLKMVDYYRKQHGCDFISVMPTNLYGPHDNFDLRDSHVLPALIRKFHDARSARDKRVAVWGTGSPRREFLFVDDLADACVFVMRNFHLRKGNEDPLTYLNVGTGEDLSIRELVELVRGIVCPEAEIEWDGSKPDGTPRKLLDVSRLHRLGWSHKVGLEEGIDRTYKWFTEHCGQCGSGVRGS